MKVHTVAWVGRETSLKGAAHRKIPKGSDWASPGIINRHWNWGSAPSIPPGSHHRGMSSSFSFLWQVHLKTVWSDHQLSKWVQNEAAHPCLHFLESHNLQMPCSRNKLALNFLLQSSLDWASCEYSSVILLRGKERLEASHPTPPPGYRSTKKLILLREDAMLNSW